MERLPGACPKAGVQFTIRNPAGPYIWQTTFRKATVECGPGRWVTFGQRMCSPLPGLSVRESRLASTQAHDSLNVRARPVRFDQRPWWHAHAYTPHGDSQNQRRLTCQMLGRRRGLARARAQGLGKGGLETY